eukprot:tig00001038_g6537.t1
MGSACCKHGVKAAATPAKGEKEIARDVGLGLIKVGHGCTPPRKAASPSPASAAATSKPQEVDRPRNIDAVAPAAAPTPAACKCATADLDL